MKSSINRCCNVLLNKFNFEKQQRRKQILQKEQQIKKIRIIKKQTNAKTFAKTFACRRCSIKYSNNIQFHKYIDEYHIKKIKFEIFTSISISSIIQNHKISTSSSSFLKKSLIMLFLTIMLNQTFVTSISLTFFIT